MSSDSRKYTIFGFVTIIIWGTSSVFTRSLSTNLGAYTAASLVNLIGGITVLARQFITKSDIKDWKEVSRYYWPVCGILFVLYTACSYISMGMAENEESAVMLVLIIFLWPLFTLLLTIPILKEKASPWLLVGVSLSFIGIAVARLGSDIFNLTDFIKNITRGNDLPVFFLGFVMALSWGLYTNLTKRFIGAREADGVGIYMVAAGVILGAIALFKDEPRNFSPVVVAQVVYASVVVTCVANVLWNLAIKRGNVLIVVLASNFLPIISTVMASLLFRVPITLSIVVGSLMVVAGTIWSKRCFHSEEQENKVEI